MASPVKVSDTLLAFAREEARTAHRSATAQIEHWATLGRAVEALLAYRDVLALKRAGEALPVPAFVRRDDVHALLTRLIADDDREMVRRRIEAAGVPLYGADPDRPGGIVEVRPSGERVPGQLRNRRFVAAPAKTVVHARRKSTARRK
jgi:ParD-like antitoxin of type II bacterial toxin-antitoxin system